MKFLNSKFLFPRTLTFSFGAFIVSRYHFTFGFYVYFSSNPKDLSTVWAKPILSWCLIATWKLIKSLENCIRMITPFLLPFIICLSKYFWYWGWFILYNTSMISRSMFDWCAFLKNARMTCSGVDYTSSIFVYRSLRNTFLSDSSDTLSLYSLRLSLSFCCLKI